MPVVSSLLEKRVEVIETAHCAQFVFAISACGNDPDVGRRPHAADNGCYLEPIVVTQVNVEHHEMRYPRIDFLDRIYPARCLPDFVSLGIQQCGECARAQLIVLNDQQPCALAM